MAPNFKSQIEQARSIANPHVAVAEFTDNSGDAGATKIKITSSVVQSNKFDLYISDNGCGMDYKRLIAAVKMGSSQKEEDSDKLFGCKGVGMNISATYLAEDSFEVYTKSKKCKAINIASIDIKKMKQNPLSNDWNSLYKFDQILINEIEDTIVLNFLESVNSGTVIVLRNMSKTRCGKKSKFDRLMTTDDRGLSRIYRHILQDREIKMFYNSSIIQSTGPGFDLKPKYQDKIFFRNTRGNKDGWILKTVSPWGDVSFDYRFRFVRVATKSSAGTSGQTGGLSIMRNGREVTSQLIAHIRPKSFGLGNLIIELDAPSSFLDKVLTFNGDKQIRTLENATENFDFRGWIKKELSYYWDHIIEINAKDGMESGNNDEQAKAWKYNESLLVDRYYEMQKESLRAILTDEEIEKGLIKEYQISGTSFRVDLIQQGLPFEFKVNGDDSSRVVGQILSYAPYLVKDNKFQFVKDNVLRFKLALGKKPSNSLKRHVEAINSSYKIGDVSLKIEIFDMTERTPKLLEYPCSRKEKNKLKDAA
jgi:hypothetical protein